MSKSNFIPLSLVAIIVTSLSAIGLFQFVIKEMPYFGEWGNQSSRAKIEAAYKVHLREADKKAAESIKKRVSEFSEFIESRKFGAKPFSQEVVSFRGKWRALKPYLPFTDKDGHRKYVSEKFHAHIFTDEQLSDAIRRSVEGTIKDLEGIENELAVALRREILGRSLAPYEIPIAAEEFKKAEKRLVSGSQWDAAKSAGNLAVSEVTALVVAPVLMRLGVSAGILSTGAANSWWTLGSSVLICIAVDSVWEWIDDPAGDIERKTLDALDKLSSKTSNAIEVEMNNVASKRSLAWSLTAKEMLP